MFRNWKFAGAGESSLGVNVLLSHRVLCFLHSDGNNLPALLSNLLTILNPTDMETCYNAASSYHGRTCAKGKNIGCKDGFRALWCILKYRLAR